MAAYPQSETVAATILGAAVETQGKLKPGDLARYLNFHTLSVNQTCLRLRRAGLLYPSVPGMRTACPTAAGLRRWAEISNDC